MSQPHIVHIIFRLDTGGLENGLVNLINATPEFRHAIICLTDATDFRHRLQRDIEIVQLGKQPGKDFGAYLRLRRHLIRLQPDILHTRNIGTLDCQWLGLFSVASARVHGEHGWDVADPDGSNRKNRLLRWLSRPLIDRWVALSAELEEFLHQEIGVNTDKVQRICNGVDLSKYQPAAKDENKPLCFGSVTRFSEIKNPFNTIRAFASIAARAAVPVRFVMVGDGPLLEEARQLCRTLNMEDRIELAGNQIDVTSYVEQMDVFVLGSRREGISNTILEAKACGAAVVATAVGGNTELVNHGVDGLLVPSDQPEALAQACLRYIDNPHELAAHKAASRHSAETNFSLQGMVQTYKSLYEGLLQ